MLKFLYPVLLVRDIQASRAFYEGLFEQTPRIDQETRVVYSSGFAIEQPGPTGTEISGRVFFPPAQAGDENFELLFECSRIEAAWQRLQAGAARLEHPLREGPDGRHTFRVLDPDGHRIGVSEALPMVVLRFLSQGMDPSRMAARMGLSEEEIARVLRNLAEPYA